MTVYVLPENFSKTYAGVFIYPYQAVQASKNNKVVLQENLISFLIHGEKRIYYQEKDVCVRPGQLVMVQKGHCLMSENIMDRAYGYRSILMFFSDQQLADFKAKYDRYIPRLLPEDQRKEIPLVIDCDEFIHHFLVSLQQIHAFSQGGVSEKIRQLKWEEILLYLLDKHPVSLTSLLFQSDKIHREAAFRKIIEHQGDTPLTIEELAFLSHMSVSTFKRKFRAVYQATPGQWYFRKKMERAARLLQNKENPSEIYHQLGFESLSSFVQSFKKFYGITPKAFQKENMTVLK